MELNRLKIAFLGDSITYGVGVENGDKTDLKKTKNLKKLTIMASAVQELPEITMFHHLPNGIIAF